MGATDHTGPIRLGSTLDALEPSYDVIVVGSGYGAGVAGSRLARAGRRVCILERGRERWPGEYPESPWQARDDLQANTPAGRVGDRRAMFEFHVNDDMNALVGCGLGGTSLINASVVEPAEIGVFEDPVWPAALRAVDGTSPLESWEARAIDMLRPTPYPDDRPPLAKLAALEDAAGTMGRSDAFRRPRIAVSFEGHVGPGGIEQHACIGCGDCVSGCNHWAKNTTLMNYLPDAVAHGAQVFCEIEVDRVERSSAGRWLVRIRLLGEQADTFGRDEAFIEAGLVVLGAGALGSTGILLRSQAHGLPVSPALGHRFSGNADVLAFGYDADRDIHGFSRRGGPPPLVGPCITGIIDERGAADVDDGLVIEEGSVPAPISWATGVLLAGLSPFADGRRLTSVRRWARQLQSVVAGPARGAAARSQVYLVMGHDGSDGRLELDDEGEVRIRWPGVGKHPVFAAIDDELQAGDRGIGAQHLRNPLWSKWFGDDLITVHPLGGCPMSDDVAKGVVDDVGRVWSADPNETHLDGLLVVDGSIVPRSVGINPLLTITALAERAMAHLIEREGWTALDGPAPTLPATTPRAATVHFTERMRGEYRALDGTVAPMDFVVTAITPPVRQFVTDPDHEAELIGTCRCPALSSEPMSIVDGRFNLFVAAPDRPDTALMRYRFRLRSADGRDHDFDGTKIIPVRSVAHLWHDTTTLAVDVSSDGRATGTAVLHVRPLDFARQLTTMRVEGGTSGRDRVRAASRFAGYFAGTLVDHYGGVLAPPTHPTGQPRRRRPLRCGPPDAVHDLTTADGAHIRLTRHRGGEKGPVLLVHGAAVSSAIFTTDLVDVNLTEHLCGHGYDVWLLDTRFSTALAGAVRASDGDQVARHDHPLAVAEVLRRTGASSLQAVVHCYGSNTFFMSLLTGLDGVRSVVASQVAAHLVTPELTTLKTSLHSPNLMHRLGVRWLDAAADARPTRRARLVDRALRAYPVPTGEGCRSASCRRATALFGLLWQHDRLEPRLHDHIDELLGPATVPVFAHLAAMVRHGHLVDVRGENAYLGGVANLLETPILLIHGEHNECYRPESTARTLAWLRDAGHPDVERVVIPGRGHLDCIFGRGAHLDVFPHIVEHLDRS